ncbi:MAG: nitrilase-related carbon-nitrogen hydrolase, partial [Anaerolineae bacterium]
MKAKNIALALGTAAVSGYYLWSRGGRITPTEVGPLYVESAAEFGTDERRGNLLGIQAYMVPHDYASRDAFYAKLNGYMMEALKRDWLTSKTVVVFPEFVGTWLVLQGEKLNAFAADSTQEALKRVVLANLPSFLRYLPGAPAADAVKYSLFRMKAASMATTYDSVFSQLAREYGVTIVAGSIVLPAPEIAA